jgi:hypothetical protein
MSKAGSRSFAELYRDAFAERDPNRKLVLLGEVQRAICAWGNENQHEFPEPSIKILSHAAPSGRDALIA